MTDHDLAEAVTTMVATFPGITRSKIITGLSTSSLRLDRLEREGLVQLPAKMSSSVGGRLGRKAGGWGTGLILQRSGT
jgi:hypothetical protein